MTTFYWRPRKSSGSLTAQDVANAVWNEQTSAHSVTGSFGALVKKLLTVGMFFGLK